MNTQQVNKNKRPRVYPLNENFFENIDTEEKAYFLGLIAADGCICMSQAKNSIPSVLTISLQENGNTLIKKSFRHFLKKFPINHSS